MRAIDLACRAALLVVFCVAAQSKLKKGAIRELAESLGSFAVPAPLRETVAWSVLVAEVMVVVTVVAMPRLGRLLALALSAFLAFGMAIAVGSGKATVCRCFGSSTTAVGKPHLVRNFVIFSIAAASLFASVPGAPLTGTLEETWPGIFGGVVAGGLLTLWDDLLFLFIPSQPEKPSRTRLPSKPGLS